MANPLPGFGANMGGSTVAPQNQGIPGFGANMGGVTVPATGTKPNGQFAGSNLQFVANPSTKRNLLKKAGYAVDAVGPETSRLNAAWNDYFKTKGLGAASWNITPTQFDPTKGTTATGTSTTPRAGGGRVPGKTASYAQGPQVPGTDAPQIPGSPNFSNLYAGVNAPKNPITDLAAFAKQYAQDQANTQFNPILAALQQGIGRQGADTAVATAGIGKLFAPVEQQVDANVASAADPSQQGIQTVQQVGSQIGQAFGLGPSGTPASADQNGLAGAIAKSTTAAVGDLAQQGADATTAAKAQQTATQQGQADATNSYRNTEQTNINALKDQLIQAISGKAAAKAAGVSAGMTLGQQTEGNYLSQLDQIATGKEQAAFADQQYQGGALDNTAKSISNAGNAYQNKVAPIVLRDQLLGNAAQRANATKQLALQTQQFKLTTAVAQSKAATAAGGWGQYLSNPKNAQTFASNLRSLLVDPKTGQPIAGTTPSSAYNTIAHTMASAGFPANTPQGQHLLVQALQGAGFDLTGYQLDPQRGLVLVPQTKGGSGPHQLVIKNHGVVDSAKELASPLTNLLH